MIVQRLWVIRPYGNNGEIHRRGDMLCVWWFSPLSCSGLFLDIVGLFLVVGENTQGRFIVYSRSPLSEPVYFVLGLVLTV